MLLLTGGSGFVGTRTAISLDKLGLAYRVATRHRTEGAIAVGDINEETDWKAALTGADIVVHLAGVAHKRSARADLEAFRRVNVNGSANLARQAAIAGVRRFVFMSSIGVLGQTTMPGRQFTDDSPPNPMSRYAISKHEAELALKKICQETGMELVILRPPLVYGQKAQGNFRRLVELVASGVPIPLANVNNRRSMISLRSLTSAIITCATSPLAAGKSFVLADKNPVSTPETIRAIANGIQKSVHLIPFPTRVIDWTLRATYQSATADGLLSSLEVCSSRIVTELNWSPELSTTCAIAQELSGEILVG